MSGSQGTFQVPSHCPRDAASSDWLSLMTSHLERLYHNHTISLAFGIEKTGRSRRTLAHHLGVSLPHQVRMSKPSQQAILQAYRALYKSCLYACRYSHPSRNILRNQLRTAFRKSSAAEYDSERIKNTLEFMNGAGRAVGIESKILKGMTEVEYWRQVQILKG